MQKEKEARNDQCINCEIMLKKFQDNFTGSIYDLYQSLEDQTYERNQLYDILKQKQEFKNESQGYQEKEQSPSLYQDVIRQYEKYEIIEQLKISITESKFVWELITPFYCVNKDAKLISQNLSKISDDSYLEQIFDQQYNKDIEIIINLLRLLHKFAKNQPELIKTDQFVKIIEQDEHLKILDLIYHQYQEYFDIRENNHCSSCDYLDIELEQNFSLNLKNRLQKGSN